MFKVYRSLALITITSMLTVAQNTESGYAYLIEGEEVGNLFYLSQAYIIYPYSYAPTVTGLMFDDYAARKRGKAGVFTLSQIYVPRPDLLLTKLELYPLVPEHELLLQSDIIMRNRGSIGITSNYAPMPIQ